MITKDKCTIQLIVQPETDISYTDDFDNQDAIKWIEENIEHSIWAWCMVEVKVTWLDITASEYLGGCSYENEQQFKDGWYYDDMIEECISQINSIAQNIITEYNQL